MAKYIFTKNSSLEKPHNIKEQDFISAQYGTEFFYEPKDKTYEVYHLSGNEINEENPRYRQLRSLKNIINYYKSQDEMFDYNKYYNQPCALYCFYSSHFGSGLKPGTINFNLYVSGVLTASVGDFREDGVLYQKNNDEKIGIVLYKEGFIIINNTSSLSDYNIKYMANQQPPFGNGLFFDNLRWIHGFLISTSSINFEMNYQIKNHVSTNLNFVYANKNQYNHSNNLTYIESGSYTVSTSSVFFTENQNIPIKNTVKSSFLSGSSIKDKQTFITHIGLYDKDKNLIGVGSLANPVKKTENREFVFKLKIDI